MFQTLFLYLVLMKSIIVKKIQSRRSFLSKLVGAGILINIPLIDSCVSKSKWGILSERQELIIKTLIEFLYPSDEFGPDASKVKIYEYFVLTISDNYLDPEEISYLINGINWIDETSVEDYGKHFEKLKDREKYDLLKGIINKEWGENYFSKVLTLVIESMFADPIYGSNPKGIVWQWLHHNPGQPRPNENNKYKTILDRKKENFAISSLEQL